MSNLSSGIRQYLSLLGGDETLVRKAHRAAQVRSMWAECVDTHFLEHTNSVYILHEGESKVLIVYVDESIYAAELNARRELIRLKLLQSFGEDISEFRILISRGTYKKNYPYKTSQNIFNNLIKPRNLSEIEKQQIEETVSVVEDEKLRAALKKAMIADWRYKK